MMSSQFPHQPRHLNRQKREFELMGRDTISWGKEERFTATTLDRIYFNKHIAVYLFILMVSGSQLSQEDCFAFTLSGRLP